MSLLEENEALSKDVIFGIVAKSLKTCDFAVKDFLCTAAGPQVTGFMASHGRLHVTVERHDELETLQFFLKCLPHQESQRRVVLEFGAFTIEVGFYAEIIPSLFEMGVQLPYPECYLARSDGVDDFLVLEDLSASGYKMLDRREVLDFAHCSLTLQELAKLHASSAVYQERTAKPLNESFPFLKDTVLPQDGAQVVKETCHASMQTILQLAQFIPRYENSLDEFQSKITNFYALAERMVKPWDVLNVINHGDLWINNMMFKYSSSNKPLSVKLLDLQEARYGPPTLDVIVLLFVSASRHLRETHEVDFLKIYHDSFVEVVHQLGTDLPEFTFYKFSEDYKSKRLLGAMFQAIYLPFVLMDQNEAEKLVDPSTNEFDSFLTDTQTDIACSLFKNNETYRERLTEAIDLLFEELAVQSEV